MKCIKMLHKVVAMLLLLTYWDSTGENTNFIQRSSWINFGNTTNMYHSVFTKGRNPNKMVNGLSINRKSRLAIIEHHASVSVYPQEVTHVALLLLAMSTLPTFPSEDKKHMVTRFKVCHTFTDTLNNPKIPKWPERRVLSKINVPNYIWKELRHN